MYRNGRGVLSPPGNPKDFLTLAPELELSEFDFVPLLNKDSTNMIPDDWTKIAKAIYERRNKGYIGFVVAHGTDTMHFSASAVALALGNNINFPVVFTGAQTAPDVYHGDARINLLRAFKVAETDIAEVVICFGDYVFRGSRAQKKDERRFEAFESPAFFPLAHITENILVTSMACKRKDKSGEIELKPDFASRILQVSLIPGLEPELLKPLLEQGKCEGVMLQSFGAGNVPSSDAGEKYSWEGFIKYARDCGKPVLITSQFPANATSHTAYEPGKAAEAAGAIPTGNMTSACATAKFRWVLAQVGDIKDKDEKLTRIREMMNTDYVGEFDVENGV
jgi:L-asparaginase type I